MILQTKITPPPLHTPFVTRARLYARLDKVLQRRLALVCAPAGYGKTSLLRDWLRRLPAGDGADLHVGWLSLDEGDDDLVRFLDALLASLRRQDRALGQSAEAVLDQAQRPTPRAAVTALLNDLHQADATFVLVLDDVHVLQDRQVHEAVRLLAVGLPPNTHMVISSRAEPLLPLGRLRAAGELVELRAADLRFTPQESSSFLIEVMGLDLSVASTTYLDRHCEGWIAGLQIAALHLADKAHKRTQAAGEHDLEALAAAFGQGHVHVFDYLAEEVLNRQPQHVRHFLRQTAILDRLCSPLCDALLAPNQQTAGSGRNEESQGVLQSLVAGNLFLAPLDEEGRWFRYHPLFRTFLRRELGQEEGSDEKTLHRRASAWYAGNGFAEEAIGHALLGSEIDEAADLVGEAIRGLFKEGKLVAIRRYLEMLPEEAILARHNFCAGYAWVLALGGEGQGVEKYLLAAEEHLAQLAQAEPAPFDIEAQRNNLALVRASVAQRRGDTETMVRISQQALETLSAEGAPALRSIAAFTLGQACLMNGEVHEAQQALQKAAAYGETAGHDYLAGSALLSLAGLRCRQGRLQAAEALYRRVAQMAKREDSDTQPALLGGSALGLGALALQKNDLAKARTRAIRAVALYEAGGEAASLVQAHTLLALVHGAGGDDDAREEGMQQALALAQQWQLPAALAKVTAWQARCALWAQNGLAARALALQAERELQVASGNEAPFGAARELVDLTLVRVYLAADTLEKADRASAQAAADEAQARRIIAHWQAYGRRTGLMVLVAETSLLQARAEQMRGKAEAARRNLLQALLLAQPDSLVRLFVDEGVWLAPLLRDVTADERVGAYAQRLLETIEAVWPLIPAGGEVQSLTARQKEVLAMLARGLSNREIAERLVISLETVRWHTKQIYRRLDVRNRTEAAAYARRSP